LGAQIFNLAIEMTYIPDLNISNSDKVNMIGMTHEGKKENKTKWVQKLGKKNWGQQRTHKSMPSNSRKTKTLIGKEKIKGELL